ncbi:hypothetical protein G6F37_012706 [Rhizopus arrhizus]|nr:hypothetical protein G6F37_012706 [Rhizopus arrhizus]
MENEEGLKDFEFLIEEETTTKKDYIDKLVLKIQQEVDKEEFENMIANPANNEIPIEYGVNYNEEILTELENWSWETPDMKPIVVLYEENIKEEFDLLQLHQKDQEKIEHIKERFSTQKDQKIGYMGQDLNARGRPNCWGGHL